MKRTFPLLGLAAALAGCSTAIEPAPRNEQAELKLQQALTGRVAGAAVKCLPQFPSSSMITIDDDTVLFRRGSTIYRNDLPGGCYGLGAGNYALVTRSPSGGLCSGDIATIADPRSGTTLGSCTLGDFIPYSR